MPSVNKQFELTVRRQIKCLLIMDGGMTDMELHRQLQQLGIRFGLAYISKLRKKVVTESTYKQVSGTLVSYLQKFIDTLEEADRRLWGIATDKSEESRVRVQALAQIRENQKAMFDKLFEAGVFEKQLGNLQLRSFMDVVRDAESYEKTITNIEGGGGTRKDTSALAEGTRESNPNPLGQGLVDLVRATGDLTIGSNQPQNSSA